MGSRLIQTGSLSTKNSTTLAASTTTETSITQPLNTTTSAASSSQRLDGRPFTARWRRSIQTSMKKSAMPSSRSPMKPDMFNP